MQTVVDEGGLNFVEVPELCRSNFTEVLGSRRQIFGTKPYFEQDPISAVRGKAKEKRGALGHPIVNTRQKLVCGYRQRIPANQRAPRPTGRVLHITKND